MVKAQEICTEETLVLGLCHIGLFDSFTLLFDTMLFYMVCLDLYVRATPLPLSSNLKLKCLKCPKVLCLPEKT